MSRILLTTSSWNSALACAESLHEKGHKLDIITQLRSTPLNFSRRIDQCHFAPSERESAAWTARLLEILQQDRYDLLVPISDLAVNLVSQARARVLPLVDVILPPMDSVEIASDKARATRLAMARGVPVPPTRFPANAAEMRSAIAELGLPAVIKIPISTGSEGVFISSDIEQMIDFARSREDPANMPFVQGYFDGSLVGVNTLAFKGEIIASHSFEIDPEFMVGGNPPYAREIDAPELLEHAAAFAKALDWSGPLDFDFLRAKDGTCVFLETNPRFSGTLSFATAAGIDMPAMLLDLATGQSPSCNRAPRSGIENRTGLQHELRWWRKDIRHRTRTFLSYQTRRDVLYRQRLSDPGLLLAQIIEAFRH